MNKNKKTKYQFVPSFSIRFLILVSITSLDINS